METSLGQGLRLTIGRVTARCPDCGREEFARTMVVPPNDFLICLACHIQTPRWALLDQMANEVVRSAQTALQNAVSGHRNFATTRTEIYARLRKLDRLLPATVPGMTVPHPRAGTPNLDFAGELLAPWTLPMSDNDAPHQKVTAQALFNQLLFALAKYQRAHKGRNPGCIQLNAQALSTLQPTQQREWLHLTQDGWMFYDIPVRELPEQIELFVLRD